MAQGVGNREGTALWLNGWRGEEASLGDDGAPSVYRVSFLEVFAPYLRQPQWSPEQLQLRHLFGARR